MLASVLVAVVELMEPYITAKFIDEILTSGDKDKFYTFILIMAVICISAIALYRFSIIQSHQIQIIIKNEVVKDLINHVHKLQSEFLFKTDMVYLSKRIDNDTKDLISFAVTSIVDFCTNSALLCMSVFLLCSIGVKWLAIFMIFLAVHALVYFSLKQRIFHLSIAVRESESRYFTAFSDNFLYVYSIKLHSLYSEYVEKFLSMFRKYFEAENKEIKLRFWFERSYLNINKMCIVIIFFAGGKDVLEGSMTLGNFVALSGYYMLAMSGVAYFMSIGQGYQTASAAYARINEIRSLPIETNGTKKLAHVNSIELRNVDYDFGERKIICGMTQVFQKGKIYCLTGKNGAGKSTLINLMCGLLHPVNGQIIYNGINISEIDMISARRKLISAVEQKDFLKNDNLSGGERRKVSISNALSKTSDVLIMDEPDNNLDAGNISELINNIIAGKENRITIIISHDKRIISIADEIIDLSSK